MTVHDQVESAFTIAGIRKFTITGLNPNLKFRLLVLKGGFTATPKGGVDPAQVPLQPIKLIPRAGSPDESKIVHGRVTDMAGYPIAGF